MTRLLWRSSRWQQLQKQQQQQSSEQAPHLQLAGEEDDDDDDDLGTLEPLTRHYVDNVTPLISSVFTSLAAVGWLYAWAYQKELWVLVFVVVDVFIMVTKKLVAKHLYTKMERDDLDSLIVMQFFRFLHTTVMFIVTKIIYDIVTFLVVTSTMYWYNYLDVLVLFVFFAFIIFTNLS